MRGHMLASHVLGYVLVLNKYYFDFKSKKTKGLKAIRVRIKKEEKNRLGRFKVYVSLIRS